MIVWLLGRLGLIHDPEPDPDLEEFRMQLRMEREAAEREIQRLRSQPTGNPLAERVRGPRGAHASVGDTHG